MPMFLAILYGRFNHEPAVRVIRASTDDLAIQDAFRLPEVNVLFFLIIFPNFHFGYAWRNIRFGSFHLLVISSPCSQHHTTL
jgi:hypothetical protein